MKNIRIDRIISLIAIAVILFTAATGCAPKRANIIEKVRTAIIEQWKLPFDSLYLQKNQLPDAVVYLPAPPDTTSEIFKADYNRWLWGKTVRPTPRGKQASIESLYGIVRMCTIYSEVLGLKIDSQTTPAIYRFMLYVGETAHQSTAHAKETYMRIRPFARANEKVWGEFDYDDLRNNGSYPSGHTALGWATALALVEIAPHLQDTILRRGYQYGESRVIVGAHWQSDVYAGYHVASAAVAAMHNNPRFISHLQAAQQEYNRLTANRNRLTSSTSSTSNPSSSSTLSTSASSNQNAPIFHLPHDGKILDTLLIKHNNPTLYAGTPLNKETSTDNISLQTFSEIKNAILNELRIPTPPIIKVFAMANDALQQNNYDVISPDVGWAMALIYAEIEPEIQDVILKVGWMFGSPEINSNINQNANQDLIQARRILASAIVASLHTNPTFQSLLSQAKRNGQP